MQPITLSCQVDPYRSGWTLLAFLTHRFRYHPEGRWMTRIDEGQVRVNGALLAADRLVQKDDVVSYSFLHTEPEVDDRYDVLYEDGSLLAVSKSGNIPVHANGLYIRHTLIAVLKDRYGEHLNLAHRLDRETSGLVLLTKHADAARALGRMFAANEIQKSYIAIVHGRVQEPRFEVDAPIARTGDWVDVQSRFGNVRMAGDLEADLPRKVRQRRVDFEDGKPARTLFSVLRGGRQHTVLHAEPVSGRTNQIRVHLRHVGHPIVGDKIYGDAELDAGFALERQALHCRRLEFAHPLTREHLTLDAPLPGDLASFGL